MQKLALLSLFQLLDIALDSTKLSLLLFGSVCELQDVDEVLQLDLIIKDEPRLPNHVRKASFTIDDLFASHHINHLFSRDSFFELAR